MNPFLSPSLAAVAMFSPGAHRSFDDPSAHTWLPVEHISALGRNDVSVAPVDAFLKDLRANFRPVICRYEGASLQTSRPLPGGKLQFANSKWAATVGISEVADARDLTLSVTLQDGEAPSSGIAATFDFADWSTANYVMIPASVYNGNRNRIVDRGYAEGLDPQDYYRKDLPLTHGSVPCLALDKGSPSKLEVNASNAATPAVCIFDKKQKRGFILLAEQAGRGDTGDYLRKPNGEILDSAISVEESADRSHATIVLSAPGVREQKPEFIGFSKSPDRGVTLKAGNTITLKLRVYDFPAAGIPAVLERFMTVRKELSGPNHPRLLLPASESLKWMVDRIEKRFLVTPDVSFYRCENGPWIAFGWVSGWMNTFPLLALGDQTHLERVGQTFDYGLKAQEPSGWFHYAIDEKGDLAFREPKKDMNLTRTHGDVLFWMIKQFQVLKAQGREKAIRPEWETSMRKLADAAVATWKKDGQWGKMVNVKTGDVSEYNSSGGVMLISGLAQASVYFHKPEYLEIAKEAASFYYKRDFVSQGQTTGACADILQNADSETAFGFCTGLMALYDATGDKAWVEKARQLANLAATWTVSYDYELPKFTALGALGTRLAGAVWASTQNKHSAPGYCTGSGDPLLKIYRSTGDARYADLLRDILRAHDEAFYGGGGTERLTYCDADSRGDNYPGSNGWTECNGAMMALEIPGIYLRTDIDRLYVFDAVKAKVLSRDADGVQIQITNPTKFTADVAIFAEDAAQAGRPEATVAFLKWPKVKVEPGETITYRVGKQAKPKQKRAWSPDNGNGTFTNPLMWGDWPDPDVIRVGDDFYLSSTSMHYVPGCPIAKSKDLVNWSLAGYAVDRYNEDPRWDMKGGQLYLNGSWATTLRHHNGLFYLGFNTPEGWGTPHGHFSMCVAKSLAGPWKRTIFPENLYDPGLLFDDDGKVYVVHGQGTLYVTELASDALSVKRPAVKIWSGGFDANGELGRKGVSAPFGLEGSHVYKIDGRYYITCPGGGTEGFQICLRSNSIFGPYEWKRICKDDRAYPPNGLHQGGLVQLKNGDWWFVIMQDRGPIGRVPMLVSVKWVDGWPMLGVQGEAKGVITSPKPATGSVQRAQTPATSDDFKSPQLGLQWQWNHNPDLENWSLTERRGYLRLRAGVADDLTHARNTLTQRVQGPRSEGTTELDVSGLKDGDTAGLGVFQFPYAFVAVRQEKGKRSIVMVNDGKTIATVDDFAGRSIWLRASTTDDGFLADFSYSLDGKKFTTIGNTLSMGLGLPWTANRFALFNFSKETSGGGGAADFHWFHLTMPSASGN